MTNATPQAVNDIRDIKPPVAIPNGWEWVGWTLGALAVLTLLLLVWRYLHKRMTQVSVEPPMPAHIRAKQKLEEALALISQPKPFVIAVSDTARTYLEERFEFRAPERTTEEFLRELGVTDLLLPDQKESLGNFLESCDLVKFARYEPRETELRELHGSAVRLVEETVPEDGGTGILPVNSSESTSEHTGGTPVPLTERAPESEITNHKSLISNDFRPSISFAFAVAAAIAGVAKGQRGSSPAFLYSSVKLVEGLTKTRRSRAGAFLAALRWLALALFIVALAQPRLANSHTEVKASGIDIVCALDMSGSMISEDFVVNGRRVDRFNMARSVLKNFINQRPDDRIGLVVFAAQAFIAAPLTLDHDYLQENLDRLEIGAIDSDATAIGDGITTALNQLRAVKGKSKIIILATDGQNNSGKVEPMMAADAAAALGVKVYTVGIGEQGTAPMPVFMNGQKVGYQNVPVDVDEATLKKIADETGGKYYRADNAEKFRRIYDEINRLEKTETVVSKFTEYKELFPWVVAGGLAVLLLEIALGQTVLRRLP